MELIEPTKISPLFFEESEKTMQHFGPSGRLIKRTEKSGYRFFRRFFVYQIIFFLICWDKELLNI